MQLLNSWYAIAFSSDVKSGQPTAAVIHDQRLALWRTSSGRVIASQDRCPHKGASLSSGTVADDRLVCGYHGWCFKEDGVCDSIPAQPQQDTIPHRAHLRQLHCEESQGFVWVWWPKDGVAAEPSAPQPLPEVGPLPAADDNQWRVLEGQVDWDAHYLRVLEAFSDLTHAPFVHSGSFGAMAPDQLLPEEHWSTEDSVYEKVLAPRDKNYRADQGRGLRAWFNLDSNAKQDESDDAGVQHIQLWLANVSLVRVVFGDFQISLLTAHVPVGEGKTRNLWRHYRSFLRTPLADGNARGRVDRFMAEDQRMVETLSPTTPDLDGRGDLLVGSDVSTLNLRKILRDKRSKGLLL